MSSDPDSRLRHVRPIGAALRSRALPAMDGRAALSLLLFWLAVTLLVSARVHYGA